MEGKKSKEGGLESKLIVIVIYKNVGVLVITFIFALFIKYEKHLVFIHRSVL